MCGQFDSITDPNIKYFLWKISHGWKTRNIPDTPEYIDRINYEIKVIIDMQFVDYFLIVSDILEFADRNKIPKGAGRGSVGGSLVAYAMGITTLDPIRFGLYFERFLNPGRKSNPDVDIDLGTERRNEVVIYLQRKYGNDRVANIITFGKMWSRAIIRNIAMALQIPNHAVIADRIAKMFPASTEIGFDEAIADSTELQAMVKEYPAIFEVAAALAGKPKSSGVHAAGVVITPTPVTEYIPLYKSPKTDKYASITQWDMYDMEDAGFLKIDLLGLNTLDIMKRTMDRIFERRGLRINPEVDIDLEDKRTLGMFSRGQTTGVFQLERRYVQDMCRKMKVDCFMDICALNALIRPGTLHAGMTDIYIKRKIGEEPTEYLHESLREPMKETFAVVLYQETAMAIAKDYAGFNLAEADDLRKAIGKKIASKMAEAKLLFFSKAKALGRPEIVTDKIFSQIETAQKYSFNKAHAVGYGKIAFHAAWFKAHFPTEYMCELINGESDADSIGTYLNEAKAMGIKIIPPSALTSGAFFEIRGDETIEFGLSFIKSVTPNSVAELIKRKTHLKSFTEFLSNSNMGILSADVIRNMINCGAFDFMGEHRDVLLEKYDVIKEQIVRCKDQQKRKAEGVKLRVETSIPEISQLERDFEYKKEYRTLEEILRDEHRLCNYYITADPTAPFQEIADKETNTDIMDMLDGFFPDGEVLKIVALVGSIREHLISKVGSKSEGKTMAFVNIFDKRRDIDGVLFSDAYEKVKSVLKENAVYLISGKYKEGSFLINDMELLSTI